MFIRVDQWWDHNDLYYISATYNTMPLNLVNFMLQYVYKMMHASILESTSPSVTYVSIIQFYIRLMCLSFVTSPSCIEQ